MTAKRPTLGDLLAAELARLDHPFGPRLGKYVCPACGSTNIADETTVTTTRYQGNPTRHVTSEWEVRCVDCGEVQSLA